MHTHTDHRYVEPIEMFFKNCFENPFCSGRLLFPSSVQLYILNVFGFCFIIKSQHKYLFSRGETVY